MSFSPPISSSEATARRLRRLAYLEGVFGFWQTAKTQKPPFSYRGVAAGGDEVMVAKTL